MSNGLVKSAFDTPSVRGTEKFVLVALAHLASDETCSCRPSLQDIADMVGLDRQTVFRAIASLEEAGLVVKISRGHGKVCDLLLKIGEVESIGATPTTICAMPIVCNTVGTETTDNSTTVGDSPIVSESQEEQPLLKENLPPTPPIRENNLSEEEKETPQTPREIQTTQVDLWGNPIAEPSSDSSGKDSRATVDCPQDILDMFEEFWEQYPLQENREASIKAFAKLLKPKTDRRAFMDTLMASIELERGSTGWTKGEYMTPVEWLKEVRWCIAKFKEFWTKYPRKVAKGDAFRAFKKLIYNKQDVDWFMRIVMASLERWAKAPQWTKDNGKFIPYPATWLNRGSWEDSKEQDITPKKAEFLDNGESDEDLLRRAGLLED